MLRLDIQVDYTNNLSGSFLSWLRESIPPIFNPFGLITRVFIRDQALMGQTFPFNDFELHNFTEELIENSTIRQQAEANNGWFVHVLITTYHTKKILGIMYDFQFDRRYRQGCAVFAGELQRAISTDIEGRRRILLRTIVHEIGHCLNLKHQFDATLMAQTDYVAAYLGTHWIRTFKFDFAQDDIDFVRYNPSLSKPGGESSRVGRIDDKPIDKCKHFRVSTKPLTDDLKRRFEIGDAVSILVKVTNRTAQNINISSTASWHSQHSKIWLKPPRAKYRLLHDPIQRCGVDPNYISIGANEQRQFTLSFFADNRGYLFNSPGLYKIKIGIKNIDGQFAISREISFRIVRPVEVSKAFKGMVNSPQVLKRILLRQSEHDDVQDKLNEAIAQRPSSGLTRVLLWTDFYKIKQDLQLTKHRKIAKILLYKLLDICNHLYEIETSTVRKGKMANELDQISKKIKLKSFSLNKYQIKHMKVYQNYIARSLKKTKPDLKVPKHRGTAALLCAIFLMMMNSCIEDEIKIQDNVQIFGSVRYNDPVKGEMALPANQTVNVVIDNTENPFSSFKTSEPGRYSFSPFRKGNYLMKFSYTDTLLQYNSSLVRPQDLDTLKESSYGVMEYNGETKAVSVNSSNKAHQEDVVLQPSGTVLRLLVTDDQSRPLSGVRVCLYASQSIAQRNAPYCGGAFAYLSSDNNGHVLFSVLQAQSYYFNARGDFGVVQLTNQWSDDMKTAQVAKEGDVSTKQIVLK